MVDVMSVDDGWSRQAETAGATEAERETVWQTVRGDIRRATGRRLAGVLVIVVWMVFQWGWGNDIVLPTIVVRTFEAVDDGQTWLAGGSAIGAATLVGGLFWALTQSIDVWLVVSGCALIPGVTNRISDALRRQGLVKPYAELSLATRLVLAYMSGASLLCLLDVFATGEVGLRHRRAIVIEAISLAIATVSIVVVIVTSALALGARVPATRGVTDVVVQFARNPLTWLAIYGAFVGLPALVGHFCSKDTLSRSDAS